MNYGLSGDYQTIKGCLCQAGWYLLLGLLIAGVAYLGFFLIFR